MARTLIYDVSIMAILPIAAFVIASVSGQVSYRVDAVDTQVAFAGKYGQRVTRTLTVSANGETRRVRLAAFHTLFRPLPAAPQVGDMIDLPKN